MQNSLDHQKLSRLSRRSNHGFTLVELLVVIAILAVLVGLFFGVMRSARKSASMAVATSNFRQLGLVFHSFASDSNGRLPGKLYSGQRSGYRTGLAQGLGVRLNDYMGIPKPTAAFQPLPLLTVPALKGWIPGDPYPGAYRLQSQVKMPDGSEHRPFGAYNIPDPGMSISQLSTHPHLSSIWALWEASGKGDPLQNAPGNSRDPIHGNKRVVLFFDWHVEVVPSDELPKYLDY
jgi:prepilin-type N-terminal cleavage/methylation domain-containing protein/prepilin-type processing-associated H-X9-DG protein